MEVKQSPSEETEHYLVLADLPEAMDAREIKTLAEQEVKRLNGLIMLADKADPIRLGMLIFSMLMATGRFMLS